VRIDGLEEMKELAFQLTILLQEFSVRAEYEMQNRFGRLSVVTL